MSYRVVVQRLARLDLEGYFLYAARRAPFTATRWYDRFKEAIGRLANRPQRYGFAPENRKVELELRQFLFGRKPNVYRVVFTIEPGIVRVLRIRRGQRRFLTRTEIQDSARPDENLD
jgi:plasmid stabilization system protein ParE